MEILQLLLLQIQPQEHEPAVLLLRYKITQFL